MLVVLQVAAFPALVIAQEVDPASSNVAPADSGSVPTSPPPAPAQEPAPAPTPAPAPQPAAAPTTAASTTGPTSPTGADSDTYTKNADGSWSNSRYTWDPATGQTRPNTPPSYSYNPNTKMWDTTKYVYSPEQGKYIANVQSTASNPLSLNAAGSSQPNGLRVGSSPLIAGGPASFGINNTGPGSNNSINSGSNTNGTFDLFFNGSISNNISSNATSGNALVQGNTIGGDALSGDASAIANLLNMLQSSWIGSSEIASFISNIDGNVYGDLVIDPNNLPYAVGSQNSDIDVNVSNNGVIDNNVDLVARSGSATVNGNTEAGDATSGNAQAIANIINLINSSINAGSSFLGMININGNFNGDILLPLGMLDALISNTGSNSTNTIGGGTATSDTDINSTTNRTINNNVNSTAGSGNALISSNTEAGSATTGQAGTSVNTQNIVGQNITGKNGILVFVNVLGQWIGMVVGPAQTTATITNTGPDSSNVIGGGDSNRSLSVNATENSLINNNINVVAESGDATVSKNTSAGDATTGNAQTSVNLVNIIGSNINFSDFFGVLFINVFGNWFGSFGADTANGGFSQTPAQGQGGMGSGSNNNQPAAAPNGGPGNGFGGQVFGFVARNFGQGSGSVAQTAATNGQPAAQNTTVFGGNTTPTNSGGGAASGTSTASVSSPQMNWWMIAGFIGFITTILVLVSEYFSTFRRSAAERLNV